MDQEQRTQSLIEKMQDQWYNLKYILSAYFSQSDSLIQQSQNVFILGQKIEITPDNINVQDYSETTQDQLDQIKKIIQRTPWMTYRRNFPPLLNSKYISDTGWGCMIRVGQMVLAQMLKKHLKDYNDGRLEHMQNIFLPFADNDGLEHQKLYSQSEKKFVVPFSIQKISRMAKDEFDINPGDWYKPNYILYILEKLHNKYAIRGSENLKLVVFNDSSCFKNECVAKQKEGCKNEKEFNSLAIFILTRIGLEEPNPEYLHVVDCLMEMPSFQGIVGGSPQRALYILGKVRHQYIYLDPHYVQESTTVSSISLDTSSFSCTHLHLIPQNQVDTSMGLSFYVRDPQQLEEFWQQMMSIRAKNREHFFIYMSETTPDLTTSDLLQEASDFDEDFTLIN